MISIHQVAVTFHPGTVNETKALQDISLDVPDGQFVTVIGSNGAGKSTFLNVLTGEVLPQSGEIRIAGERVTDWLPERRAGLVARVFQDPREGTCERLTIEENLALAARRGAPAGLGLALKAAQRARFRDVVARLGLGLESRLDDLMGLLSGGQRQALSLVMSTLAPMKVLLLDEHTAALDPKTAGFVTGLTERIIGEMGLTALMVTHSMRQALDHGDRLIMLHEGRIVLDVRNEDKRGMAVEDLLRLFEAVRHEELTDDRLLLA